MRRIETNDWWDELLAVRDELSLRELSERYEVTAGAISAAFKRLGIVKIAAPPGPRALRRPRSESDGAPAPATTKRPPASIETSAVKSAAAAASAQRPGSKDELFNANRDLLGTLPDRQVAERLGVSMRTVAGYRARFNIPGFSGNWAEVEGAPKRTSKLDAYQHLVGTMSDRALAEMTGVSLNASRNYRIRIGVSPHGQRGPSAPRDGASARAASAQAASARAASAQAASTPAAVASAPAAAKPSAAPVVAGGSTAWSVAVDHNGTASEWIVVATSIAAAAAQAERIGGTVQTLSRIGPVFGG